MVVVSRQAYELTSASDPRKKMILPRGILTDVPEDFQDHTFQYGVFAGTISVPHTHNQKVAADNGEMSKPISRLTAKEAREEPQAARHRAAGEGHQGRAHRHAGE